MKSGRIPGIIICIYILVLCVGLFLMLLIPSITHREQLRNMTDKCIAAFRMGQVNEHVALYGMQYVIFDADGSCIVRQNIGLMNDSELDVFSSRVDKFPEESYVQRYMFIRRKDLQDESRYIYDLSLVLSKPFSYNGGSGAAVIFLIRPFMDLLHNIVTYAVAWLILFVMHCVYYYLYQRKKVELEERERMYMAGMNHELKSPITSIKALSETLLDGMVTDREQCQFYYATILKEADRLETTVQEILDYCRLQDSKRRFSVGIHSVEEVFGDTIRRYKNLEADMDFQLSVPNLDSSSLPLVRTNRELIAQLLDIILHNALKFIEEDGKIKIDFAWDKKILRVAVTDNGRGISKENLPHVFEKFYTTEPSHHAGGSGLGLALAKEIALYLKEDIKLESEAGTGTRVEFTVHTADDIRNVSGQL